ncbi:MAG: ankyrin repeat domain-containing protein [Acetobacteraceae bacterium]|nr:ankyrin repeat domain-containing protein [Acetobacteraceae bacterium]
MRRSLIRSVPLPWLTGLLLPATLGAALVAPSPAGAQGAFRGPVAPQQQAPRAAPPALPGLQGRRAAPVIPASPEAAAMSPNDALFDAINRGDIAAAREAVGRGADIDSRNVLGLTAIDSAVDQGRTDILFYLLSVRGTARAGSGPPPEAAAAPRPTPQTRRAAAAAAREAELAAAAGARPGPPAARLPRLWANDGGAPIPSIGFLGFDAGRPSGGPPPTQGRTPAPRGRG